MIEARSVAEYRRPDGKVGFVPTMGAFHEGHLSLMRAAKRECDYCIVSLFVNPLQFAAGEDFDRYPRNEERDFQMARKNGVDVIFCPPREELYGESFSTSVKVGSIGDIWEGAARPGHFDGVATVVAKLFNIVRPDVAYFGEKDFQQCAVISRMVRDLNFHIQLRFLPTVREQDGLAMSSRNAYLSDSERVSARAISQTLAAAAASLIGGADLPVTLEESRRFLERAGLDVDYFALVSEDSLVPLDGPRSGSRLITAVRAGKTRLIDNMPINEIPGNNSN